MFCTNCHKIDITTGYCSWVEIHPYEKKQYLVESSMLHRHLIFSFFYWYNRQVPGPDIVLPTGVSTDVSRDIV